MFADRSGIAAESDLVGVPVGGKHASV